MSADGILRFKTDNRELFLWSMEQFVSARWHVQELSFDIHESNLPDERKITTHYERTFMAQGIPINYLAVAPPVSATPDDRPSR